MAVAATAVRIAVVLGATGNIGSGAVKRFLESKWTVLAPVRDPARAALPAHERLSVFKADVSTEDGAKEILAQVSKYPVGSVRAVVSSMGPWWRVGPLHTLDAHTFDEAMTANFKSHFMGWSTLGRKLIEDGHPAAYMFMTGAASEGASSVTSVSQAALIALARVAGVEAAGVKAPVRVYDIHLSFRVESDEVFANMSAAGRVPAWVCASSHYGQLFTALAQAEKPPRSGQIVTQDIAAFPGLISSLGAAYTV